MTVFNSILPVATLVLGYAGTLVTESVRDRRARSAAVAEREDRRREERKARRDDFELRALLQARSSMADLARSSMEIYQFDTASVRGGAQAGKTEIDDELDERARLNARQLTEDVEMILDDQIRDSVDASKRLFIALTGGHSSTGESVDAFHDAAQQFDKATRLIGRRIRALYGPDETPTISEASDRSV